MKNSAAHHTDQYEVDYLVLRRGQSFKFTLKLARALTDEEKATIIVSTGRNPYPSKGTCPYFITSLCALSSYLNDDSSEYKIMCNYQVK